MSNLSIALYEFENDQVRVLYDPNGEPLFVVNDICHELGIKNPRQAVARLDEDEKGVISNDTPGGKQNILVVNEPGLYSLALTARNINPRVKRFKRWITHELLPDIRKHGGYILPTATPEQIQELLEQIERLQSKLDDAQQVNYWLSGKQGAGRHLSSTLPRRDRDE